MKGSLTGSKRLPLILIAIFCMNVLPAGAQTEEEGAVDKRFFFGGNFGVTFGDFTAVNLSPQVGYRFNRFLAAGTGINFIYSSVKTRLSNGEELYRESYGNAGLNVFGRVYPSNFLFLQIQPEYNYNWGRRNYRGATPDDRLEGKMVPSLLGGLGVSIPAGRGSLIAMLQYDILQERRSPYGDHVFFTFGYNF